MTDVSLLPVIPPEVHRMVSPGRRWVWNLGKIWKRIIFVHGCGKKQSKLQKDIKELETYLAKYKEYNQKIHTCGKRSSYSKTDNDATFMRMKEDHLGTGQLEKHQKMAKKKTYEYGWLQSKNRDLLNMQKDTIRAWVVLYVRHWISCTQEKNNKIIKSKMELFWSLFLHKRCEKHKIRTRVQNTNI